jgi:hypothetical protein
MHVNPSPKFVRMTSNLLRMQMETKGAHAGMDVGVEAARLVWSGGAGAGLIGWCRYGLGFHHIFGSTNSQ